MERVYSTCLFLKNISTPPHIENLHNFRLKFKYGPSLPDPIGVDCILWLVVVVVVDVVVLLDVVWVTGVIGNEIPSPGDAMITMFLIHEFSTLNP